jgi:hypothetical protein
MVTKPMRAPRYAVPKFSRTNSTVSGAVIRSVAPKTSVKMVTDSAD